MKQKPRWTLEMLTASLAVLCGLLVLVLLIQRPTAWPALLALVVLWGVVVVLFRCQLRKWVARWMCGGSFESSKLQFSLEPLSQPAALLSGETVLWYNAQFRARLLNGQDALVSRVQKVLSFDIMSIAPKQEYAVSEFGTYEYDKKSIEKGKEVPVKEDDHCMDAIRYCVMGAWKRLKYWLPKDETEEIDV